MTEAAWLACVHPGTMLEFLRDKASDRKLRLFACACYRPLWDRALSPQHRIAVQARERYADDPTLFDQFCSARYNAEGTGDTGAWRDAVDQLLVVADPNSNSCGETVDVRALCRFVRCIFGSPFHHVAVDPAWRTATVTSLAQAIYADRAFDCLPILADALEDAGCTSRDILDHCRQPGEHVRGCWVVDLVLGKE